MRISRHSLRIVSVGMLVAAVWGGCKPPAGSDTKAVVGVDDDGREAALGLLAVRNWTDVPASKLATSNQGVRYAEGLIRLPMFALIECKTGENTASAELQMLDMEHLSLMNNLFLDKNRNLVAFRPDNPDEMMVTPCWMVRDKDGKGARLLSWRVISESSNRAGGLPQSKPSKPLELQAAENAFLAAQATYLALRGSYVVGEKPNATTPMLGKLLEMAQADTGVNIGKIADMKQRFAKADAFFNPCVDDSGLPWYVKEYRNRNFACSNVEGRPNLRNFRAGGPSGKDYVRVRNLLTFETAGIHDDLYGKEAKRANAPVDVKLWDALTSAAKWTDVPGAGKGFGEYLAGKGGTDLEGAFRSFQFEDSETTGFGLADQNPYPGGYWNPLNVSAWAGTTAANWYYRDQNAANARPILKSELDAARKGQPVVKPAAKQPLPPGPVKLPPVVSPQVQAPLSPPFQEFPSGRAPSGISVTRQFLDPQENAKFLQAFKENPDAAIDRYNTMPKYTAIGTQGASTVYKQNGTNNVVFSTANGGPGGVSSMVDRDLKDGDTGVVSAWEQNRNQGPGGTTNLMWDAEKITLPGGQQVNAFEHASVPHGTASNGNDFGEYQFNGAPTKANPTGLSYAYKFAGPGDSATSPADVTGPARSVNGYFQPAPEESGKIVTAYRETQAANQQAFQANTQSAQSWNQGAAASRTSSDDAWKNANATSFSGVGNGLYSYAQGGWSNVQGFFGNAAQTRAQGNLTDATNNSALAIASRDPGLRAAGGQFSADCFSGGCGPGAKLTDLCGGGSGAPADTGGFGGPATSAQAMPEAMPEAQAQPEAVQEQPAATAPAAEGVGAFE